MAISTLNGTAFGTNQIITANGITFPATQVPSSDANTLDDYEEGTWTPGLGSGITVNSGSFAAYGSYVKVGRVVTIQMRQYSGNISWNTQAYFTGMPFTPISGTNSAGSAGSYTNDGPAIGGACLGWTAGSIYMYGGANSQTGTILNMTFIVS